MAYTAIFREIIYLTSPRVVLEVRSHRFHSFCGSKSPTTRDDFEDTSNCEFTVEDYTWGGHKATVDTVVNWRLHV